MEIESPSARMIGDEFEIPSPEGRTAEVDLASVKFSKDRSRNKITGYSFNMDKDTAKKDEFDQDFESY